LALSICLAVLAVIGLALAYMLRSLRNPATITECDFDWLSEFSTSKYRPMLRLLAEDDFKFLEAQEGYEPSIGKRLRTERLKIFRGYLRNLIRDYHRLHLAARLILVYAPEDRSDLAAQLVRCRVEFAINLAKLEFDLFLYSLGIGAVDVRALLGSLDSLQSRIASASSANA
jgi:hypothetical protein